MGRVQGARRVAFAVLTAVREDDAYANLLLPALIRRAGLRGADAALATTLTYGTLRMLGYYDRVISIAARRDAQRIDPPALDALRLGAHQLLAMRVAPHAAVNESVELARGAAPRAAGFVNGVLRTIGRTDRDEWTERVARSVPEGDEQLAALHSHPGWVVAALREALEAEGAGAELGWLLAADNNPPGVGLVALPGLADRDVVGGPERATEFSPLGFTMPGGDPAGVEEVVSGAVRVQDEGSQLAALALSRVEPVREGERWLDLCAGPGGKAALLAAEAAIGGATLVANESVPARAELVRRALEAVPGVPEVRVGDGRRFADGAEGVFDRVLLDAPCSGLGALRRRPEARWRKRAADLDGLTGLQAELLDAAMTAVAPGGLVAYVTCSPVLAETRDIVDAALDRRPGFARIDTVPVLAAIAGGALPGLRARGGGAQLWPHRHRTDAMHVSLLRRDPA